jgi:hypothetical protein
MLMEKYQEKTIVKILAFLSRFPQDDLVTEAIKLYLQGSPDDTLKRLNWIKQSTMPEPGKNFISFDGDYWVCQGSYNVTVVQERKVNKECSECGEYYFIYNVCPGASPRGYHSRLECPKCLHEEYYIETKEEILSKYGTI